MDEYVKQALDIVKAQASVRAMTEEEMMAMVTNLAASLRQQTFIPGVQEPAVDPQKAIKETSITCLECGKSMKMITRKHLAHHDLTPKEYREKWGYKKNTALIAKALSRARKKRMKAMQLWTRRGKKPEG